MRAKKSLAKQISSVALLNPVVYPHAYSTLGNLLWSTIVHIVRYQQCNECRFVDVL